MTRRRFHPRVYAEIIHSQGGVCACGCGAALGGDPRQIEFDHGIPLADGGRDEPANLRAMRKDCHKVKSIREAHERAKHSRLARRGGRRKMNAHDRMLEKYLAE